jgi:hypothetical protein
MAYYRQQLWTETVSAVTATPSVDLGTRRIVGGSEYVYMYNGATVADKRSMVKPLTAGVAYTFSVTTVAAQVAPVCGTVENQTIIAGSYGWICTKGYTKVMIGAAQTLAVGGALAPVRLIQGADGVVDIATGGTGTTGITVGFLTSAISDVSNTSVGAYVCTGF